MVENHRVPSSAGNLLTEDLLASQEGICSMEMVAAKSAFKCSCTVETLLRHFLTLQHCPQEDIINN
jgi:hypothetical protein